MSRAIEAVRQERDDAEATVEELRTQVYFSKSASPLILGLSSYLEYGIFVVRYNLVSFYMYGP